MYRNLENICRVCLSSGSRNIFEKTNNSQFPLLTSNENVSSFDRLLEKLRYVTMLKIDENENLPKCICDSCIIQLNVAYNLKKAAVQSDIKLRQYVIEYGVNVTTYTTCINTVAIVRPPGMLMSSNSGSSPSITTTTTSAIVTTEKQTTTTTEPTERPPFAVMPMIIKEEPSDYEAMSDITIETNSDENGHIDMPHPSLMNGPIIARQKEKRNTPLVRSLMVAVNDKSLLASSSTSDVDYINAYMQTPSSASDESPSESTSPTAPRPSTSTAAETTASSSLSNQKQSRASVSRRNEKKLPEKGKNSSVKKPITRQPKASGKSRELKLLQIDLKKVPVIINGDKFRPSRTSLGKIEPKNYYTPLRKIPEPSIAKGKRSIGSTVVGGKHLRDRSNSSHRSSSNGPLRNMNRSASRRTSAISSVQKNMKNTKNSSRHRSSL